MGWVRVGAGMPASFVSFMFFYMKIGHFKLNPVHFFLVFDKKN
jgi:hypothetical protein